MGVRLASRLVRPLLEPLGDLAVLLSGLRDVGSGLFDLLHGGRDLRQAARGPARHVLDPPHLRRARRHRGRDVFDLVPDRVRGVGDVLGGASRLVGELPHLFRDHREAAPVLSRPRRLDRRVQGEQIGLRRDAPDEVHEVVDRSRLLGELRHLLRSRLDDLAHVEQHARRRGHVAPMPVRHGPDLLPERRDALCRLRHLGRGLPQAFETRGDGVELAALVLGALGHVDHGGRDLARRSGKLLADR